MKQLAIALALLVALEAAALPAMALSTSQEVAQGRSENAQIDANSVVVQDPFLVSWVNSIGNTLAQYRQRRDIQYHFTILAAPDINAFAIKGGYVHVDLGLLNFVSSDDELASTMGHEMGHVELRHVVKSSNQGTIIGILAALASLVSPVAYVLGGLGGELATDKFSRIDELQADHYGLQLMAKAGYDPQAAVDIMSRLARMDPGPESRADKAFIDHPVPKDRISHLLGYPELDQPPAGALTAQAIHDQAEGRFSYAAAKLKRAGIMHPSTLVTQHTEQLDYALRESGGLAAPDGRVMSGFTTPDNPRRAAAAKALQSAIAAANAALLDAKTADRTAQGDLENLAQQLDKLGPQIESLPPGPRVTNSAGVGDSAAHLTRDITGTIDLIGDTLETAPGLINPNIQTLRDMSGPFDEPGPLTPKYQALLAYYPGLIDSLNLATKRLTDSIQLSRDAISQAVTAVQISQNTLPQRVPSDGRPDISSSPPPPANIQPAITAWEAAYAAAQHASDEMYAAQTQDLSTEITLLDVLSSPERYAAFRNALRYRFPGQSPPDYQSVIKSGIPPGDLACATWFAFDTHSQVGQVLSEMKSGGQTCEEMAMSHHLLAESMEIAEGLVYEDYVDLPQASKG